MQLCYFSFGAVAGTQLCCALDILYIICYILNIIYIFYSFRIINTILSNAQQSCVPATAPKRKVAKLHFVCLSIFYLCTIYERMQLKVWRIENLRIEGPKSRSGASKIEVRRVQNRGLEGFLAALGAAGRSWDHPEGVVVRLGGVLEPLLGGSWAVLGARLGRPRAS